MKSSISLLSFMLLPETLAFAIPEANAKLRPRFTPPTIPGPTDSSSSSSFSSSTTPPAGALYPTNSGNGAVNLTVTIPVGAMMTDAPVKNATAIVYSTPTATQSCLPDITDEFEDSEGNLVSQRIIPGTCPTATPVPVKVIDVEGHVRGGKEVVEIEIKPLGSEYNSTGGAMNASAAGMPGNIDDRMPIIMR